MNPSEKYPFDSFDPLDSSENQRKGQEPGDNLDNSLSSNLPKPSPHLAQKTCRKIWDLVDGQDNESPYPSDHRSLPSSDISSSSISQSKPTSLGTNSSGTKFIPKFARFERSSNKSTPFVLKKVTLRTPAAPVTKASLVPKRPLGAGPSAAPQAPEASFAETNPFKTPTISASPDSPVASIRILPYPTPDKTAPSPLSAKLEKPAVTNTSVKPKLSLTLEELKREFAKERAQNARKRKKRFRSPLINGEIREELRGEYYWEILPPENLSERQQTEMKEKIRVRTNWENQEAKGGFLSEDHESNLLEAIFVDPVVAVGHTTLMGARKVQRIFVGETTEVIPEEMNKPLAKNKKKTGKPGDILISIIAGILIAVTVVFPIIRITSYQFYQKIVESNVRHIGQTVTLPEESPTFLQFLLDPQNIDETLAQPASASTLKTSNSSDKQADKTSVIKISEPPQQIFRNSSSAQNKSKKN